MILKVTSAIISLLVTGFLYANTFQVTASFTQPSSRCQNVACAAPVTAQFEYTAPVMDVGTPTMLQLTPDQIAVVWNAACAAYVCANENLYSLFSIFGTPTLGNFVFYYTLFGVSQSVQQSISGAVFTSYDGITTIYTGNGGTLAIVDLNITPPPPLQISFTGMINAQWAAMGNSQWAGMVN